MDPEYLPEAILLLAGLFVGGFAVHLMVTRRFRRGAGLGGASLASILLAFALGRSDCAHSTYSESWRRFEPSAFRLPLTPASTDSLKEGAGETSSAVLLLGGTRVWVRKADRYVLSLDGEPFLTLDSLGSGLLVSCRVSGRSTNPWNRAGVVAASVSQNMIISPAPYVKSEKPDAHTLVIRERGDEVLRVQYISARNLEVMGHFYVYRKSGPSTVSFIHGIRWPVGMIPPGANVDLTPQGFGDLDFQRSGVIQVIPAKVKT